jgi:hypothetical protein
VLGQKVSAFAVHQGHLLTLVPESGELFFFVCSLIPKTKKDNLFVWFTATLPGSRLGDDEAV